MSDEFPRKPNDNSLISLLEAIASEGTHNAVDARQQRLAESVALVLGVTLKSDRAVSGFGAFLDDLATQGGPQDVDAMVIAFRRWHDCGEESAELREFGVEPHDLHGLMAAIAVLLWNTGEAPSRSNDEQAWNSDPTHTRS